MHPLVREFRILFWAILGVIVPFGFLLYVFPGGTEFYWAWVVPHPRSAMLIGSAYVGAIAYYLLALKENDWEQTRNGMGGLIIFCLVLLLATLLHWNQFRPYHITTLVWLGFYYVGPFLVPVVYRLQSVRSTAPERSRGPRIAEGWRVWLIGRGFFFLALALFWVVSADTIRQAWPWPIESLELRVFAGQPAIIGWNSILALSSPPEWPRFRLGILLGGAIGLTQLMALLASPTPYVWSGGMAVFLPILFLEWVITSGLLYRKYERKSPVAG